MAEASYIPLTEEALDDLKEIYQSVVFHMRNTAPGISGKESLFTKWKRWLMGALLYLCFLTMTRRTKSPGSFLSQKRLLVGWRK